MKSILFMFICICFSQNENWNVSAEEMEQVKIYILNSNGQYIGTLLDEVVDAGIHTFDFTSLSLI